MFYYLIFYVDVLAWERIPWVYYMIFSLWVFYPYIIWRHHFFLSLPKVMISRILQPLNLFKITHLQLCYIMESASSISLPSHLFFCLYHLVTLTRRGINEENLIKKKLSIVENKSRKWVCVSAYVCVCASFFQWRVKTYICI